jgi:hypothetical protein
VRDFRAPREAAAQERTWQVVASAYAEREPARRRRIPFRPALALACAAAVAAVAATPPGRAVLTSVREAIGVEHARPALDALPGGGRVLAGAWVVDADGSTRRLGDYREASWSPYGRFVVAAGAAGLAALTPHGVVRWTLGRPHVAFPRWAGSHVDTRIAYLSGRHLRVVAGDGTGDREVGPAAAAHVAPAWRPGTSFTLAYADTGGHVWVFEPDGGRLLFRTPGGPVPTTLAWSSDGSRLLVLTRRRLAVYDLRGRRLVDDAARFLDAAFLPGTRRIAVLAVHAGQSQVSLLGSGRVLFRTTGILRQLVPSPDGRRLLVTWPAADQWLFVPVARGRRLTAVGNIAKQLPGAFPVAGWTS